MFRVIDGYLGKYVRYDGDFTGLSKIEAIKKSIEKWEFIAGWHGRRNGSLADGGDRTCALCKLYHLLADKNECAGCPILDRTGETGCQGTPYMDYRNEGDAKVARQEVTFLKTLLRIEESDLFEVEYEDGNARLNLKRPFGPKENALEESIEKWNAIVAICSDPAFKGRVKNIACNSCALCHHYRDCEDGCPVFESGHPYCRGTPCVQFGNATDDGDVPRMLKQAKAEVEFLEGLRPKRVEIKSDRYSVEYDDDGNAVVGIRGLYRKETSLKDTLERWSIFLKICQDPMFKGKVMKPIHDVCPLEYTRGCENCPLGRSECGRSYSSYQMYKKANKPGNNKEMARFAAQMVGLLEAAVLEEMLAKKAKKKVAPKLYENDLFRLRPTSYNGGGFEVDKIGAFSGPENAAKESMSMWQLIVETCDNPSFNGRVFGYGRSNCAVRYHNNGCIDCPARVGLSACDDTELSPLECFRMANGDREKMAFTARRAVAMYRRYQEKLDRAKAKEERMKEAEAREEKQKKVRPQLLITGVTNQSIYFETDDRDVKEWMRNVCNDYLTSYRALWIPMYVVVKEFIDAPKFVEYIVVKAKQKGFTVEVRDGI